MKKSIYLIAGVLLCFACKKESNNSTQNTVTNSTNTITCIDNPNINFTSIGTPIGKFGECIKDIDGNVYKTVTIGSQTWMAENLKVSKYNDGTPIPNITDSLEWFNLTTGAWCNYKNLESNNINYGKLYNWYTVSNSNKNVCPTGWHVPTNVEWTILIDYLGGTNLAGAKMKEIGTTNWISPNNEATNTSLFTGLPSGYRGNYGYYYLIGNIGYWWSSTEIMKFNAMSTHLNNYAGIAFNNGSNKENGLSIRCLKD